VNVDGCCCGGDSSAVQLFANEIERAPPLNVCDDVGLCECVTLDDNHVMT
jgi:hypothetical protein